MSADYGPFTAEVSTVLDWITSGELLKFRTALLPGLIPVSDFSAARERASDQGMTKGMIDWVEIRERADAGMHEPGLLDLPVWAPFKDNILNLLFEVGNRVDNALPDEFLPIIDDVTADLHACCRCLAVHGRLDPFHELLWKSYKCGGWPCGCTTDWHPTEPGDEYLANQRLYVFWQGS